MESEYQRMLDRHHKMLNDAHVQEKPGTTRFSRLLYSHA
jgi:hypothetical protein